MIAAIRAKLRRFLRSEDGPTAVEYAVMMACIVAVCVGSVHMLANSTRQNFDQSAAVLEGALNP
jgi:pilus assembly protein Flp/PilA